VKLITDVEAPRVPSAPRAWWLIAVLFITAIVFYSNRLVLGVLLTAADPATGATGAELALQSNPLKGLTLGATAAVGDAKLKQVLPLSAGYGVSGDRLPFAPKLAATFMADQEVPLSAQLIGFAGATVSYTGSRLGTFVNPVSTDPLVPASAASCLPTPQSHCARAFDTTHGD